MSAVIMIVQRSSSGRVGMLRSFTVSPDPRLPAVRLNRQRCCAESAADSARSGRRAVTVGIH
jgi:hypothetical protein